MATTIVSYDSKRLIPAPFVSIQKSYDKTGDATNVGTTFQIQVNGTLVAYKGSPSLSGVGVNYSDYFWTGSDYPSDETQGLNDRLEAIVRKQEAIRRLFKDEGRWFEVQAANGQLPLKFRPRINSIDFQEDLWVDTCKYTINMEADVVHIKNQTVGEDGFSEKISSADESWNLEFDEQRNVFNLTHTVGAKGKRFYTYGDGSLEKPAWQQARDWVLPRLGFDADRANASGVWDKAFTQGYNHVRAEQVGEMDGSYSVNESWVVSDQNYIDEYTVNINESIEDGLKQVGIDGVVTGLDTKTNMVVTTSRYSAASGAFYGTVQPSLYARALSISNLPYIHSTPTNYSLGINQLQGTFSYNYSFNNRPLNCISGARFENISLTDSYAADVFAIIPVLGRSRGPVIQPIGTVTEKRRSLNIEVVMEQTNTTCANKLLSINNRPNYSGVILALKPVANQVYVESDQETWDLSNARGSRQVTWIYQ